MLLLHRKPRRNTQAPPLHTAGLVEPEAEVWFQKRVTIRFFGRVFTRVVRHVRISSLMEAKRSPQYSAIGILNPRKWSGRVREVHDWLLQATSPGSRLVGQTFDEQEDMECRQNRLSVVLVPKLLLPGRLQDGARPRNKGLARWLWWIEAYNLYVFEPKEKRVSRYALLAEPKDVAWPFKPRAWLGVQWWWRAQGKQGRFYTYLAGDVPPRVAREDLVTLWIARILGWCGSVFTLPVAALLQTRAQKASS